MRNWTAFDIIEDLGDEMDIMRGATSTCWRCWLSPRAYRILKNDPSGFIYEKDGKEYVKVWDNHRIPFVIHMRIAGEILGKNGLPTLEVLTRREPDEVVP